MQSGDFNRFVGLVEDEFLEVKSATYPFLRVFHSSATPRKASTAAIGRLRNDSYWSTEPPCDSASGWQELNRKAKKRIRRDKLEAMVG